MTRLPNHFLRSRWVSAASLPPDVRALAARELDRASRQPGWSPKVIRLRRALHLIDVCGNPDGSLHSVRMALLRDHPALARLGAMAHVPRVVKTLYRKQTRLAHARAHECWPVLAAMDAAEGAWARYHEGRAA